MFLVFISAFTFCDDLVVLHHSGVYIRTGPSTAKFVVGEASKGELYRLVTEKDEWFQIEMFSGDTRFISKSFTSSLKESELDPRHNFVVPSSEAKRKDIYNRIQHAKKRADREAEEIIPNTAHPERNMRYRKILEDRFILKVFQNHEMQPGLYPDLIKEGAMKKW
jgi:uncharacterized protein YgiM (DUF1202 family)